MREDNLHPKVTFEGRKMRLRFKYPPTQEEFTLALVFLNEAMAYANKVTGRNIQIIEWLKKEDS